MLQLKDDDLEKGKSLLADITKQIKRSDNERKPVLIGIEGFGGSGKTTLANQLKEALGNAYVVSIDDFIVKEKLTEPSWDKSGFDRQRLEKQVLIPASNQQSIEYQALIWTTNELNEPKAVPTVDYLIIEGISSYHPDIAHYYDYKIWIDVPIEIAKERGRARDDSNENAQHWDLWATNDLRYQEKYHPELVADFVVSNSFPLVCDQAMRIRQETSQDYEEVYRLITEAFQTAEHTDGNEQDLVALLRESSAFVPELSLVAEVDRKLAGHILLTEATVGTHIVLALAPLAVKPEYQRMGVGTALIRRAHAIAKELGYGHVVVFGSAAYYSRFGYRPASLLGIKAPTGIPAENLMAITIRDDAKSVSGILTYAKEFGL